MLLTSWVRKSFSRHFDAVIQRIHMPPYLVLFDVDGTLLITGGASSRSMLQAGRAIFGSGFRWAQVMVGTTDPQLYAELAKANGIEQPWTYHPSYRQRYLDLLAADLDQNSQHVKLMAGIGRLLGRLRQRRETEGDVLIGVLTGNYRQAVEVKFRHAGLALSDFDLTVFGEDASDRPGLVEVALRRYEQATGCPADPARVVVVGDTPRDVQCARAHDCQSLAVATGRYSVKQLRETGASYVVSDLSDGAPLLAMLDA